MAKFLLMFFFLISAQVFAESNPADKFVGSYEVISFEQNNYFMRYHHASERQTSLSEKYINNQPSCSLFELDPIVNRFGKIARVDCKVIGRTMNISTNYNPKTFDCDTFEFPDLRANFRIAACYREPIGGYLKFNVTESKYEITYGGIYGIDLPFRNFKIVQNDDNTISVSVDYNYGDFSDIQVITLKKKPK